MKNNKIIKDETPKDDLVGYYYSHDRDARRAILAKISLECGVTISTVQRWIYDSGYKIQKLYGEKITNILSKLS